MGTVCHNQLIFESLSSKDVVADFAGDRITPDAGGLLLREIDQRYRLTENATRCLRDSRQALKVKHDLLTLVRQRMFAIAQGYEDNNDAATLARDPAFKIMAGKAPGAAGDLASQPTMSRFENQVTSKDLRHLSDWQLTLYLKTHLGSRKVIVLDMDATMTPPTANSSSASSTVITKSTCIIRSSSSMGAPGFPWPRCCAPATPTPPTGPWRC
jgi:hypothetical protein